MAYLPSNRSGLTGATLAQSLCASLVAGFDATLGGVAWNDIRFFNTRRDDKPGAAEIAVPGMFITAFFVSLDPRTGTLYCGNCGHPPANIVRSDGQREIVNVAGDLSPGIVEHVDPPMMAVALGAGDTFVLYTDGVTEARDHAGTEFGVSRLVDAIATAAG